jgi:hypothetical protein
MASQTTQNMPAELLQRRALKRLSGQDSISYLERLHAKLNQLSSVLARQGDGFVVPYVNILLETLGALKLKYQLPDEQKINFSLTIDPRDCGFPSYKDFYAIRADQKRADSELAGLQERADIIELVRQAILTGQPPEKYQHLLMKHNFYTILKGRNLFKDNHLNEPKRGGVQDNRVDFTLNFSCLERTTALPVLYQTWLRQDSTDVPLDERMKPEIESLFYQASSGIENPLVLVSTLDTLIDQIHPKLIYKYTIGPYYDQLTQNPPEIQDLLNGFQDASILCFSLERVSSIGTRKRKNSLLRQFTNRVVEKEYFGPIEKFTNVLTDFRIAQRIRDRGMNRAKVYAVTEAGEASL